MSNLSPTQLAKEVVAEMLQKDRFSQWLDIRVIEVNEGYCKLQMTLKADMANGFGIAHGGITFSLADSAFAFACNSRNNLSVALDASITYTKAAQVGDVLTAEAKEFHDGRNTGLYLVSITNQHKEQVALFKGTCWRTGREYRISNKEQGISND